MQQDDGGLATVADYSYDDVNSFFEIDYGNGALNRFDYDALRRTTRVQLTAGANTLADYGYGYDDAGNRTYLQRNHLAGDPADVYRYDDLYQLTQAWYGADATDPVSITAYDDLQTYTLDTLGHRLEVAHDNGSGATTQPYGPHDTAQLTDGMNRYGQVDGAPLSYDARGNTLSDGLTDNDYGYDILNRQTGMANATHEAEYVYDAMGRRIAAVITTTGGVTTTHFIYDSRFRVVEERSGESVWVARYTYGEGVDEALLMERGGNDYYLHHDALGSVTEVTGDGGALVERYEYDVYGQPLFFDGGYNAIGASAIGNPYLFTGRRFDAESGNYYYRARIYSPGLGRFLSMDPLGFGAGDANLYRYVFNNPTNYTDPSGQILDTLLDVGFIIYDIYVLVDHLKSGCGDIGEDLLALGLDVGGALIPFVTGGGLAVRAAGKIDNVGDLAGLTNKLNNSGDAVRRVLVVGDTTANRFGVRSFEYSFELARQQPGISVVGTRLGGASKGLAPLPLQAPRVLPNLNLVDNIDATHLKDYLNVLGGKFDDIVFNAPRGTTGDRWTQATAQLINDVLESSRTALNPGGNVRFSSSRGMPGGEHLQNLLDYGVPGYSASGPFPFLSDDIFGLPNYRPTNNRGQRLDTILESINWYVFGSLE